MTRSHSQHRYRRIGWGAASGLLARFVAIGFGMWAVPLLVAYLGKTDYGVLLVGQSGLAGFDLAEQTLSAMAGMVLVLELLGPVVTQRALMAARETHVSQET